MKWKRRKSWTIALAVLLLVVGSAQGKSTYYMDSSPDCSYIGTQDVERDQTINVYAKTKDTSTSTQAGCAISFMAVDSDATIRVDFASFLVNDCNVKLYLYGDASGNQASYGCGDNPNTYFTVGRTVTISLHKTDVTATSYNFQLQVKQIRDDQYPLPSDSNPVAVGMVIGIVGSVFGVIFIVLCIGICCFRKRRARKRPFIIANTSKAPLDDTGPDSVSVGFTNESMHGSPTSKKKLLARNDSSSDSTQGNGTKRLIRLQKKKESENVQNKPPPAPPAPVPAPRPDILKGTEIVRNGKTVERDTGAENPRSSMLNALHSNPRFRNSFRENERDAEERAKRISSSSFEQFGQAPRPPAQENKSRPLESVPKSPKGEKKPKLATIGRKQRTESFSDEERPNRKKGRGRQNGSSSSNSEVSVATSTTNPETSKKAKTTHALRPDRKAPKGRKKQSQSVSSALDPEPRLSPRQERKRIASTDRDLEPRQSPRTGRDRVMSSDRYLEPGRSPRTQRDRFVDSNRDEPFEKMGSGRYSKRSNGRKSPRPGRTSGRGFSHRRGRSMDHLDSRPTTPSMYGSLEDLDLPPLKRSTSKQSIYSSRSSLYDRRGRRRKGSFTESVASHVRDDISVGRHSRGYEDEFYSDEEDLDGYLRPLSRREQERMYRSDNDLGRRVRNKESATQTLRETATQTGVNEAVLMESKRLVQKKRRSKSLSTAGTQTKREKKAKTKSTERLDQVGKEKTKSEAKRSKSVPDFTAELEDKDKPRPKPKPRKSQSAANELGENVKSASQENLADPNKNPYYPQSEGFVPHPLVLNQQGYPMMPPPGYPAQPGVPAGQPAVAGMPVGYQFPGQSMPLQGYPGYSAPPQQQIPHTQATQPVPQGQPTQRQPRKSNWEMLCELTDGEYKRDDVTETGSVASSVFTNNPASMQGYGAPRGELRPPNYSTHQFYLPYQPGTNHQTPPLPPMPIQSVADYENASFGPLPAPPVQSYGTANRGPQSLPQNVPQTSVGRKQSSWDQLKQLTEQPKPAAAAGATTQAGNSRTESVV